jgi:gentisate 1,2-dioxygenase
MTLAIDTPGSKHNITGARQAYYAKISKYHLAPLWEVLKVLSRRNPRRRWFRRCGDLARSKS